jgi:hypothetical protein
VRRPFGGLGSDQAIVACDADGEAELTARTDPGAPVATISEPAAAGVAPALERRGRAWLLWSFLFCPCHLPLSLAALTSVLAGTSFGVALRDNVWLAGTLITAAWVGGTGYGFRLIRQAERANGACPVRRKP